jgi:histone H3/H4
MDHHLPHHLPHHHHHHLTADDMDDGGAGGPELTDDMISQRLKDALEVFWRGQIAEMEVLEVGTEQDFKNHNDLPLARIKRIMKSDEDVRMISAEAPVLFAKACEMFILELTLRAWGNSEKCKRKTLQKEDIESAIRNTDIFDFLVDLPQHLDDEEDLEGEDEEERGGGGGGGGVQGMSVAQASAAAGLMGGPSGSMMLGMSQQQQQAQHATQQHMHHQSAAAQNYNFPSHHLISGSGSGMMPSIGR